MQKLQTILVSILVIVALFTSIYFPYKWKQLNNDFLDQTNHYGELLKQINDLQKEVRDLKNGDGDGKISDVDKEILSSEDIYFSEEIQGTVFLYSLNAEIKKNENQWCGGPIIGAERQSGDFILSFKNTNLSAGEAGLSDEKTRLDLGRMEFIEETLHNGEFHIKKLNPASDQNFIVILQYGSCNFEEANFYGYDFNEEKLIRYKFKKKDGKILDEIFVNPSKNFLETSASKDFTVKVYDNSIGKNRITKWKFNGEENIFEEMKSWTE